MLDSYTNAFITGARHFFIVLGYVLGFAAGAVMVALFHKAIRAAVQGVKRLTTRKAKAHGIPCPAGAVGVNVYQDAPSVDAEAAARDAGAALALDADARKYELEWAISKAARAFPRFTSDEVWNLLREIDVTELDHPNAMGAAFLQASRAGIIENTGRVRKSARAVAHRRAVALWRSLVFGRP